jgi:hypothetical protein
MNIILKIFLEIRFKKILVKCKHSFFEDEIIVFRIIMIDFINYNPNLTFSSLEISSVISKIC